MVYYCERCDRDFFSNRAYWQHVDSSSRHNICYDCNKDFPTWVGLKEHWVQSPRHDYCQYCEVHFQDFEELEDHYKDVHWWCSRCRKVFANEVGLHEHYRQSSVAHHYCAPCKKLFTSASNLNSHLNSSIHRPKDIRCPTRDCRMTFVSRAALVLHLESGSCVSGIDRRMVNALVKHHDTNNLITDRLLTTGRGEDEISYMATSASWNGVAYECYLCYKEHRTLSALNQHLASPRHAQKFYLCRGANCGIRFSALSALVQHIESQKCGVSKFSVVQNTMDSVLGQMGRLTL